MLANGELPARSTGGAEEAAWRGPKLRGGRLCLDFVNTLDPRFGEERKDFIATHADLVHWSRYVGAITDEQAAALHAVAREQPAAATAVQERAATLREALYRAFVTAGAGDTPDPADVDVLNAEMGKAYANLRLSAEGDALDWTWADDATALDRPLWAVVRCAAELLTSKERTRVHGCEDTECGWLFLDTSKNRSRHWCSMESCGSRAKAKRYYQRQRGR